MKLHPTPESIAAAVVSFPSTESAIAPVVDILSSSASSVARMEFLDEKSIEVVMALLDL